MSKILVTLALILGLGTTQVDTHVNVKGGNEVYTDFKLMQYMPKNKNYMVSPLSIKMAMMLAANGAEGQTQQEILKAFDIDNIEEYNTESRRLISKYSANDKVKLSIANSIWAIKDRLQTDFRDEYKQVIADYYSGTSESINSNEAVQRINDWVSEKTNKKIEKIINSSDFEAALVNAIYFKGDWAKQFKEHATKKGIFTDRNGKKIEKDFMTQQDDFKYYEDDTMQMVMLPYSDYNIAMYVVLPKSEKMDFDTAIKNMKYEKVNVKLPKFKVEYDVNLNDILNSMGINKAFSDYAEFDKMCEEPLKINKVLHKTFIDVDENGTEAAAVTAIIMEKETAIMEPIQPKIFNADKPFIYFIRDNESGEVLFMGEIAY